MTIAGAYLTSEGVVFGADSATTVTRKAPMGGRPAVSQLFNHAQKIYEIGESEKGRLALCTWGAGSVVGASHRTLAARLADTVTPKTSVMEAAESMVKIIEAQLAGAQLPSLLGYFLGGWNTDTHNPECVEIEFQPGKKAELKPFQIGEARFQGAPEMFQRAYLGIDPRIPTLVFAELSKLMKPPPADLDKLLGEAFNKAIAQVPHGGFNDMPLREAIDFIHMYLHLTIKAFKFRFGAPIVGGPLEIGFVSTDRNFRWVRHKPFDSAIFQEENSVE